MNDTLVKAYLNNHWIYLFNSLKTAIMSAVKRCRSAKNINMEFIACVTYELSRGDTVVSSYSIHFISKQEFFRLKKSRIFLKHIINLRIWFMTPHSTFSPNFFSDVSCSGDLVGISDR